MTDAAFRPLRSEAEVVANEAEGGANRRLRLALDGWPGFAPGQFVMLSAGAVGAAERLDPLLPRPMAVYREERVAGRSEIEILYKQSGRGTTLLAEAACGDRIRLVGPLGRGFPEPEAGRRALLVGGGTGVASLYELAARASGRVDVRVLLGARTLDDLMGHADFEKLGVDVRIASEDGSAGTRGLVTDLLEADLAAGGDATVYACGPTPMMRRAAEIAAAHGQPARVSLENPMACGFGVCLGCAVPGREGGMRLVCRDGPVFDADEIDWEQLA